MLKRIERELPWVRNTSLTTDNGRSAARADYVCVAEAQPEPHDEVVALARNLHTLLPSIEIALCRAIDPTGALAGAGGFHIADKRLARRALPSQVEVAWNRARSRAVVAV